MGEYSSDGGRTFQTLFTVSGNLISEIQFATEHSFVPTVTDNFRLRILRSSHKEHPNSAQLSEVEVFGEIVGEKAIREKNLEPTATPAEPLLRPSAVDGLAITSTTEDIEFRSRWLRLAVSKSSPRITAICWDSLGAGKVNGNLLKPTLESGVRLHHEPVFPDSTPSHAAGAP